MQLRSNLSEGVVGAIQWGVTGFFCFLIAFASAAWYLSSTRATYSIDGKPAAIVFLLVVLVAGFLWGLRNPNGRRKRIEVTIWLLVLGFALPMVTNLISVSSGLADSVATFSALQILAHGLAILVAYGSVYGLGLVVFLPEEGESVYEG